MSQEVVSNLTPAGGELSHWDNMYMWESSATVLPRRWLMETMQVING